jgi:uncharacterized protein YlxP (DUF503 family)
MPKSALSFASRSRHVVIRSPMLSPALVVFDAHFAVEKAMFVGLLWLSFQIPGARTLKDKRQVVRSFRDRVRARLDVSIAEVSHLDAHQRAAFGVSVVSNEASVCDELLASVASMAENVRDAIVVDRKTEIMPWNPSSLMDSELP